ncbi:MAG: DUF1684 domain-containing protein [Candidatus Eisenbacteria sp.]|nr:DUF1684 domain-containing protein [Candidatus Eisenbacteria bacterium]
MDAPGLRRVVEKRVCSRYKRDAGEETLFIPFGDATSGHGIYNARRYVDLESASNRTSGGR